MQTWTPGTKGTKHSGQTRNQISKSFNALVQKKKGKQTLHNSWQCNKPKPPAKSGIRAELCFCCNKWEVKQFNINQCQKTKKAHVLIWNVNNQKMLPLVLSLITVKPCDKHIRSFFTHYISYLYSLCWQWKRYFPLLRWEAS